MPLKPLNFVVFPKTLAGSTNPQKPECPFVTPTLAPKPSTMDGQLPMQKKMFWLLFFVLGLVLDFSVPILWSLILTLPLLVLCWWIAYRSGWFE